ncbi:MAG: undecaprenyl-diphosphate phosphatase [Planctomycetes bacterium]|nr:undecaprenyl-diphosphate phosphatase [Planctomycetota bacterium]
MNWWQALVLGIVEGLSEYLPISSTGHLILAQRAMGIGNSDAANAYAIVIQGGAILAVLSLYAQRIRRMAMGLLGRDEEGKRLAIVLLVALIPLPFIALADKVIEKHLFGLWPVALAWFIGGAAILVVSWYRNKDAVRPRLELSDMTWRMALIIGVLQVVAVWPGTSRSLMTIVAGVLVGLNLAAAVEFSFLLGVATLGGATILKAVKNRHDLLDHYSLGVMLLGFFCAFISAVLAVKWMVGYLKKHGLEVFGYYRVALAIVVVVLMSLGYLVEGNEQPSTTPVTAPAAP